MGRPPQIHPRLPPGRARQRGAVWLQRPAPKAPGVPGQLPAAASCSPRGCCWHGGGGRSPAARTGQMPTALPQPAAPGGAFPAETVTRIHLYLKESPKPKGSSGSCFPSFAQPFSPVGSSPCFQEQFAKRPAVPELLQRGAGRAERSAPTPRSCALLRGRARSCGATSLGAGQQLHVAPGSVALLRRVTSLCSTGWAALFGGTETCWTLGLRGPGAGPGAGAGTGDPSLQRQRVPARWASRGGLGRVRSPPG